MSNVLDPSSVLHTLSQTLPKDNGGENQSEPLLRNNNEGIAALSHAIMLSVGFRLVGLGEDGNKGKLYFDIISGVYALHLARVSPLLVQLHSAKIHRHIILMRSLLSSY
jgi:PI31 proteasome regulator N-terminal